MRYGIYARDPSDGELKNIYENQRTYSSKSNAKRAMDNASWLNIEMQVVKVIKVTSNETAANKLKWILKNKRVELGIYKDKHGKYFMENDDRRFKTVEEALDAIIKAEEDWS